MRNRFHHHPSTSSWLIQSTYLTSCSCSTKSGSKATRPQSCTTSKSVKVSTRQSKKLSRKQLLPVTGSWLRTYSLLMSGSMNSSLSSPSSLKRSPVKNSDCSLVQCKWTIVLTWFSSSQSKSLFSSQLELSLRWRDLLRSSRKTKPGAADQTMSCTKTCTSHCLIYIQCLMVERCMDHSDGTSIADSMLVTSQSVSNNWSLT